METFRDVLTALNFELRLKVEGVEEGAWFNNIVDLFLKNPPSSVFINYMPDKMKSL